ncbi:hypothetical protein [Amycolatopsis sp. NPDC051903]|uniref:hypothetical protein n=1 Tax=Amycolatopsis sp. NPDC051903 TaxID=3363936 RepID=UPI00378CE938
MTTSLTDTLTEHAVRDDTRDDTAGAGIPRRARERSSRETGPTLHRLAAMASLQDWIRRSSPVLMHEAVLAGENPAEVAAAARLTVAEAHLTWNTWASRRLATPANGEGLTLREYLRVHTAFAGALNETAPAIVR